MFAYDGAQLVVDSVSLEFVRGATIDYAAELIKSNFEVSCVLPLLPPCLKGAFAAICIVGVLKELHRHSMSRDVKATAWIQWLLTGTLTGLQQSCRASA